ncbi:MAG: 1-acyl-sn-glycerol-3-phosphate acyltransferase [Prolixibacteraceae bacterium]|nr:1-acyl-sn-glycerol-3-phosphate acyltransferase [Prolixibacteraceae bacterium]
MKNWSLGYEIIRTYVRFALWLTHKRIVVTGRHFIPKGKPIIFAPNHQNALMDPLAIACTNSYQTMWLARADLFKSKMVSSILKYLKLLPVYRIRDGKDNLSNNEYIFQQVTLLLENQQTVALFPEAAHSGRRQMLPHKKAIPRISLEAEAKNNFKLDLQIVPVGIYYDHYWAFNRSMIVVYGEAISIDKYRQEYEENPQKAMLSLRDEIFDRLAPLTLQINSDTYYQDYEDLRLLAGKTYSKSNFFNKNKHLQLFYAEKALISQLEHMETSRPEEFGELIEKSKRYFGTLKESKFKDWQIEGISNFSWPRSLGKFFAALASLPIFIFGFVFNAIPFIIPRKYLHQKVKNITFLSTFNFGAGLIIYPIAYAIEAGLIKAFTQSGTLAVAAFILMPFAGKYAWQLLQFYRKTLFGLSFLAGNKTYQHKLGQLAKQRNELINYVIANAIK